MKKTGLIFGVFLLVGCVNREYDSVNNTVKTELGNIIKMGPHSEFRHILPNGDSLFKFYFIDSGGASTDCIYYTTGGNTKMISWETGGKFYKQETVIQK